MHDASTLPLHFSGPLTFTPGPQSLFHSPLATASCIYLWTFEFQQNGQFYIHYVGQTRALAQRQREHLVRILGLDYGIFCPDDAQRGVPTRRWPGLWRDKSADAVARALEQYAKGPTEVLRYVATLRVFVAPLEGSRDLREHVEGSIGWNLRNNYPEAKTLYPDDVHIGTRATKMGIRLAISSDAPIAGIDSALDI